MVIGRLGIPVASSTDAPIAARFAPILMQLATNSRQTNPVTSHFGQMAPMLTANPDPVTRPILALTSWIADISG